MRASSGYEGPVACHNILDIRVKEPVNTVFYERISKIVEGPLVFRIVSGGQPVAHDHIGLAFRDLADHLRGRLSRIGVVAVHHDVDLRVDLPEHSPDDIALALLVLMAHHSAGRRRKLRRPVRGIVVIDIDHRLRQDSPEILHDLFYRFAFIVAGDKHRYLIHILRPPSMIIHCRLSSTPSK